MLSLKLCWSLTLWKEQVSTVRGKVLANLGITETSSGLSYVVFSRLRRFKDIAIEGGLCVDRLTNKINLKSEFKERRKYKMEVLLPISALTLQRYISENVIT